MHPYISCLILAPMHRQMARSRLYFLSWDIWNRLWRFVNWETRQHLW